VVQDDGAPAWPKKWWVVRFVSEPFLTREEWRAYLNALPARYTRKELEALRPPVKCEICGGAPSPENPLQAAHRIPFAKGIQHLALTPRFLNSPDNLRWAHSRVCNQAFELKRLDLVVKHLQTEGIMRLPRFLPTEVLRARDSLVSGNGVARARTASGPRRDGAARRRG